MDIHNNRLSRLRAARQVTEELEAELGEQGKQQIQRARSDLETAGRNIRSAGFERYMQDALGRVAGIAIGQGLDRLSDRATRIMDDEIEPPDETRETVEATTDDRGRITLGNQYSNHEVTVAILEAKPRNGDSEEGNL